MAGRPNLLQRLDRIARPEDLLDVALSQEPGGAATLTLWRIADDQASSRVVKVLQMQTPAEIGATLHALAEAEAEGALGELGPARGQKKNPLVWSKGWEWLGREAVSPP